MAASAPPSPLVDASWVADHRDRVVLADVRWYLDGRSGRDAYREGHIPGAIWIDLDAVLADVPSIRGGRHPLPPPDLFAARLAAAGVGDTDAVVAYDDSGGMSAGRLVWLLRIAGLPAALLDGGLAAWPDPLRTGDEERPAATFSPRPWPHERLASIDEVSSIVAGRRTVVLVDARAPARYRGETEPVDPRPGHIPGAINLPYGDNLDGSGRFLPVEQLRARFNSAGIEDGTEVVAYCGSGVSACVDLLALEAAGLGPGRLYPGSWSQWSADRGRPATTGAQP